MMMRLATWPARHPWLAMGIALALGLLSLLGVSRMRADASLESMLDADDPAAVAMTRVLHGFGAVEDLLVLASVPAGEPGTPDEHAAELYAFAERLDAAVRASPEGAGVAKAVVYRPDAQTRAFFEQVVVPAGVFYLDDASFEAARHRLTRGEMAGQIRRNEAMIAAPGPAADALAQALLKDPLRLHEFVLDHFGNTGIGAYLSPDSRSLLIRVIGKSPISDIEFAKRITSTITDLARGVNADGLELDISGGYAIAAASERAIRADMTSSVIGSVVCLQLLFIVAYRQPFRCFFLAFCPVALGVLYGFGICSIVSPTISPATAVVGAILAGMGIDYSVHYLSHFQQVARTGRDAGSIEAAVARASAVLGPPLIAACATSIIGFLAIGRSHVRALRDLSFIGSLGLACALVAAFWVVPALLALADQRHRGRAMRIRLDVRPLLSAIARHRRLSLGVGVAMFVAAVAITSATGDLVQLESDLTVMHPRPNPALDAQAKIAQRMGTDPGSLLVYLRAKSPDALTRLAHDVEKRLKSDPVRAAGVVRTFGLATLLPDPEIVAKRREAVPQAEAQRVVADFRAVIADSSFSAEAYEPYAGFLGRLLSNPTAPAIADLKQYGSLADMVLGRSGDEAVTLIFLDRSLDQRDSRERAVTAIRDALADVPGATLTGLSVIHFDTEQTIHREFPRLLAIAGGMVLLYLLVHFRSISASILSLVPTVFSLACLAAFTHVSGQKLNLMNLVAIPLLIGMDVDYGIFLVSLARRSRREGGGSLTESIAASCHAVCISALTTVLGFGSLIFTSVPAIRSLGWAAGVGMTACLIGTFFVLAPMLIVRAEPQR